MINDQILQQSTISAGVLLNLVNLLNSYQFQLFTKNLII